VSPRQRGNPVLHHISNVAYEFGPKEMSADYVCGDTCCALYLSLKYHLLHNNYLAARLQGVGTAFTLRVLLLLVDVDDSERPLLELTQLTFAYGWTLVCCWSVEEVARYLETLRAYEKKTAQAIAERVDDSDHAAKLTEALTEIRSINKTDVRNLAAAFGSFAGIAQATPDDLSQTMGMGERKVRRLHHVMTQPFITSQMARRTDAAGGTAITTPAQAAAAHAAAMEKAKAQAAQPAKRSAIVFFNQLPTTNAPATPAAASNPRVSASPPAAASSSLPPAVASASSAASSPAATAAALGATAATAQSVAAAAARPTVAARAPSAAAPSPPPVPLDAEFDLSGFAS
jgi:DNA repair protein Rad10